MLHAEHPQGTQERPKPLLRNRITLQEIAREIGGCERSARNLAERLQVPYLKVVGVRFYDCDKFRAALLATETRQAARGRGRPRKAA